MKKTICAGCASRHSTFQVMFMIKMFVWTKYYLVLFLLLCFAHFWESWITMSQAQIVGIQLTKAKILSLSTQNHWWSIWPMRAAKRASCAIVVEALLMVFPKILHNVPFDDSDAVRIRQRQQVVFGASPCWNQDSKNDKPLRWRNGIWVFPKIGEPQNGWFIMENPIKMGWFGGTPIFGNPHIDRGLSQ